MEVPHLALWDRKGGRCLARGHSRLRWCNHSVGREDYCTNHEEIKASLFWILLPANRLLRCCRSFLKYHRGLLSLCLFDRGNKLVELLRMSDCWLVCNQMIIRLSVLRHENLCARKRLLARIISTDGIDNRCINRMNTHNNDFKERHDFGLFWIHIFINRDFDFF